MKRAKEDAADRLVEDILRAVRRYKAAKDAPAQPVQLSTIHEDAALSESAEDWMARVGYLSREETP